MKLFFLFNVMPNLLTDCSLGVRNRSIIPDSAMTASSIFKPSVDTHDSKFGRLDQPYIPGVTIGAWAPLKSKFANKVFCFFSLVT